MDKAARKIDGIAERALRIAVTLEKADHLSIPIELI